MEVAGHVLEVSFLARFWRTLLLLAALGPGACPLSALTFGFLRTVFGTTRSRRAGRRSGSAFHSDRRWVRVLDRIIRTRPDRIPALLNDLALMRRLDRALNCIAEKLVGVVRVLFPYSFIMRNVLGQDSGFLHLPEEEIAQCLFTVRM